MGSLRRGKRPKNVLEARRAEEFARVRDVHAALGGSREAFNHTDDQPEEPASLGARLAPYTRRSEPLATPGTTEATTFIRAISAPELSPLARPRLSRR